MITIKLNDKSVNTDKGKTILQVAEENGIHIPTLCHDKELNPFGSCWVCAVEVKGRRGFVTACGTEIADGMEIVTDSKEVRAARKMALELLLSDHYADCEAPCKVACPDHVDIQTYVSLIANGEYHEAVKVIKKTLPMPLSIGRVCPAFCEAECRRKIVEEPIAIRQLKRYAADFDLADEWQYVPEKEADKDARIAIIGAGPSGLTCGFYLTTKGYSVDVFEASPQAGGWLRYGIPEYRLPKAILDKEIELMCANGMKIHTNKVIGSDVTLKEICRDYDAIYMAIGAQKAVPMRIKGSTFEGCFLGVDFLKDFTLGKKINLGKKVAIVGGGNTAIDCARTAVRMGASVTLIYRRTRKEMPAEAYEVDAAEEEGVKFYFLTNPVENFGEKGKLKKVKFEKMVLGEPDDSGRRRPEPTGEFFEEKFDSIIAAISQAPDVDFLLEKDNKICKGSFPLSRWSTAVVDEETMFSGIDKIFAGGDFRRGPATAIEAIADGRIASESIDRFIQGKMMKGVKPEFDSKKEKSVDLVDPTEYEQYEKIAREKMPELAPNKRSKNFDEVEIGFSEEAAIQEASRCLECGCQVNETCSLRKYATEYEIDADMFAGGKNKHPIDNTHPYILRDANKCIKCGRCVRICAEVQGPGVLGYIYRGFASYVAPELGETLTNTTCESCGKCIEVCPVGALVSKNQNYKLNPYQAENVEQSCGLCGTGCKIDVHIQSKKVSTISAPEKAGFNDRNLCFNGRFGWQYLEEDDRITKPYLRKDKENEWQKKDNPWKQIDDYQEIIPDIKEKLENSKKPKIYISPTATNEEICMMKRVAKTLQADISSISYSSSFVDKLINSNLLEKTYDDLDEAEVIVVIGEISGTLRNMIRAKQRNGKKLIVISNDDLAFNRFADELFNAEQVQATLDKIINYYSEDEKDGDEEQHEKTYSEEESIEKIDLELPVKTVFVYNRDQISEETIYNIWYLASLICDFKDGSGVFPTSYYSNFRGLVQLGVQASKPEKSDLAILYGELPNKEQSKWIQKCDYIVSFQTHIDVSDPANVIIPKPSYLEIDGTAIADDGHTTRFKNPKQSNLFEQILKLFHSLGLLKEKEASETYWKKEVSHFFEKKTSKKAYNDETLYEYLHPIDDYNVDIPRMHTVQKIKLSAMKRKFKG